jgi:hypothetical protein
METNRERENRLVEFIHKQRKSLPHSIEEYELEELSKKSGFSVDEIKERNEEVEKFWEI